MPRTPEVCPTVVCPLSHVSKIASRVANILPHAPRLQPSAFGHLRSNSSYRLSSAVLLLRCSFCLLVLVISCHCSLVGALAQGTTATLSGTVTDQNDAVIPDVSIAVINIAQGFQRSATTNGEGAFVVPLLPPGNYIVKAEHAGFTPTEVRDVVLNVNDQVAMKIHMSVGKISQSVEIVDGAALINGISTHQVDVYGAGTVQRQWATRGRELFPDRWSQRKYRCKWGPESRTIGSRVNTGAHCLWRNKQFGVRRCSARIQNPNFNLCPRVWASAWGSGINCYTLGNEFLSRYALRVFSQRSF